MSVLDGTLVVEIGVDTSGRFAGRILAEHGARVIRLDPTTPGAPAPAAYERANDLYLDAGKEIVRVDLEGTDGRAQLHRAFDEADVVIETLAPGGLASHGVEVEAVLDARPGFVLASLTPYGQTGPRAAWRGSELTMQAAGGFLNLSGSPGREPVKAALDQVHLTAGRVAAFAVLASLLGADSARRGVWIDVALVEVAATLPPFHIQQYAHTGAVAGRGPEVEPALDGQHVPTLDGAVTFATGNTPPEMFAVLFEDDALLDERFATPAGRAQHRAALERIVHGSAARRTSRELFERALSLGITAGMVQSPEQIVDCPHLAARGALCAVRVDGSALSMLGLGFSSPDLPVRAPSAPRPAAAIPARRAARASPTAGASTSGGDGGGRFLPLAGVRVLSFEDVIALPWATVQLARLGASVVRVESPSRIQSRHWGVYPDNEPGEAYWNRGANLYSLYRAKRSVALDLSEPHARDAVLAVAARSDVVLDNFRPGVMQRLGLGDDALHGVNPRLVVLHCSGYGVDGPYAGMGAFARTVDAMSGLTDLTGYRDGPPVRANPSYMDMVSAWNVAVACTLGLLARRRTGRGTVIDHSMYEAGVSTVGTALVAAQLRGGVEHRRGNEHPLHAPQGVYRCGGGRYIALTVDESGWHAFDRLANLGCAGDPRFATVEARRAHRSELDALIEAWCEGQDAFTLEASLQAAGVAASVVRNARDVLADEHLRRRGFFEWVTAPGDGGGPRPYAGSPFRFAGEPRAQGPLAAPALGEHNAELLLGDGGLSPGDLRELEAAGAVRSEPAPGVADAPRPLNLAAMVERRVIEAHDEGYAAAIDSFRREALR